MKKDIGRKIVFLTIALFLVSMLLVTGINQTIKAEEFGTDLHASPGYGRKPDIALDDSYNIYLTWNAVKFAKSIDSGETFTDPLDISDGYVPSIAVDDSNNIHVAVGDKGNIYYTKSTDGGNTFSDPIVISDSHGGDNPDIATYEDNVYIVWTASYLENLSLDKSIDGNGFGTDVRVNSPEDRPAEPTIAIGSDETIYVAYENGLGFGDSDIRVVKSTDQAATFGSSVVVDDGDKMSNPSIAALGEDNVYLSYWNDDEDLKKVRFTRSTDGADSFRSSVDVSHTSASTLSGGKPNDIAVHPCGKIFVIWQDDSSGEDAVYFANSTDGGTIFGENFKVNDGSETAGYPAIAVASDTQTYIVWQDDRDDGNIFFDKAVDATWPSKVSDLSTNGKTTDSIRLQWTATGDNFDLGTVSSYTVKYSTESITDENWDEATLFSGSVDIDSAGNTENLNVTGLEEDTLYYFALKANDEIPNTSPLSNVINEKTADLTPPSAITDLKITKTTDSSVTLEWTSPGDNQNIGTASAYIIKYSNNPINNSNWDTTNSATGVLNPKESGTTQSFEVNGLNNNTAYYFAIKTQDEVPNTSPISNIVNETTLSETTEEKTSEDEDNKGTPGFEIILLISVIALFVIWKKHKK